MHTSPGGVDSTKILTRRELAAVLNDLVIKAPRSRNTRMNLILVRLACCCGLRPAQQLCNKSLGNHDRRCEYGLANLYLKGRRTARRTVLVAVPG